MVNKFEKFNLDKNIIKSLNNMKYEEPSKVQDEVIPFLLNKNDIIVKSKTGSGKTASFAIPIVEKIDINNNIIVHNSMPFSRYCGFTFSHATFNTKKYNTIMIAFNTFKYIFFMYFSLTSFIINFFLSQLFVF